MKISLRSATGWLRGQENKSRTNCDTCGSILWTAPHAGKYCNRVHQEAPLSAQEMEDLATEKMLGRIKEQVKGQKITRSILG